LCLSGVVMFARILFRDYSLIVFEGIFMPMRVIDCSCPRFFITFVKLKNIRAMLLLMVFFNLTNVIKKRGHEQSITLIGIKIPSKTIRL
jgi:hypothetical protein